MAKQNPSSPPTARAIVRPARHRPALSAIWLVIAGAVLSGCAVGPDYVAPTLALPATFIEPHQAATAKSTQMADAWWKSLGDPILDKLIDAALQSAPSLAEAEARVHEARAQRGIAGADDLPHVDADSLYRRSHGSNNVPTGVSPGGLGPGKNSNLWQVGFDASWELDLFGGQRRAIESTDAGYAAVVENRSDAVLTLEAEIARDYIELRGAQRRATLARENLAREQDALKLTQVQLNAGLVPRQEVLRIQAQVADLEAMLPLFESNAHAAAYRVAALMGKTPADSAALLSAPKPIPHATGDVPVGLPSDLLRRRPDIRAAERRIAEANARIGVAKADLYPHFSLSGITGLESLNLSSFRNESSGYYAIGPSLRWRIFDAGKIRFQVQAETARTDEAAASYQRTVFNALRDVETALVSYGNAQLHRDKLLAESATNQETVGTASLLYRKGVESYLPVLDAEQALYASQDKLAQSDQDTALALVSLYKALGGGWQAYTPEIANTPATSSVVPAKQGQ